VKKLLFLIFIALCVQASFAQPEPPAPPAAVEELYLARDNGAGKAGDQATEFNTTDIPIYCVVLLDTAATTKVKMNFVAVSVAGVKPDTKVVTASYTTKEGQNRVNFSGRPEGRWTAGKYRVDIFLDGKLSRNVEFEIKGAAVDPVTAARFAPDAAPAKPRSKPRSGKGP
jgi:hypothetical protein